jgi:serine protease
MDKDAAPPPPPDDTGRGPRSSQEFYRPYLVVKLKDGIPVDEGESLLEAILARDASTDATLEIDRLFNSIGVERLAELQQDARRRDPDYGRDAPDLNAYFAIWTGGGEASGLIAVLESDSRVELVYEAAGPERPPALVTAGDNPEADKQGYLNPAPGGVDAWYGWELGGTGIIGSDGTSIGFIDIEQGWMLDHSDLIEAGINLLSGQNKSFKNHGTSVLGIVRAVDNKLFCVGIANECNANVVSEWRTATDYSRADAILSAISYLGFGDVLLIESQITGAPVEVEKANFDAIRLGTALGIIVIEPAGNGGYDLDTVVITWGSESGTFLNRAGGTAAGFKDSGAIMVAAASSAAPHTPAGGTSVGSRVDCYGWGENAFTLGITLSELDPVFNGTSAASAIIAGTAIVVQGAAEANLGFRLSPAAMRVLLPLPANSTPSKDPATDRIGRMPNLRAIFEGDSFKLSPDIFIRDHVGDTGDPHSGPISSSPDIIVRTAAVADPQATFGEGSGTENDVALSDAVQANTQHYVHVRVRNRGQDATGVQATVYWAPSSTLVTPDLWTEIGSVTVPAVPGGNVLTVSNAIVWPADKVPATGHYCFVALIGTAGDPAPAPSDFADMDEFRRFVRERNNATWRNFNVISGVPGDVPGYGAAFALPFEAGGPPDRADYMELELIGGLPVGARTWIEMPSWMVPRDRLGMPRLRVDRKRGIASVPVSPSGRTRLGRHFFPEQARVKLRVVVTLPEKGGTQPHEIAVRQLWHGEEVGRVTWQIAGRGRQSREDPWSQAHPEQMETPMAEAAEANVASKGGAPTPYLTRLMIEWCDGKGNVFTRWVDITKITAISWNGAPGGGTHPSSPKVPGSKPNKVPNVTCPDQPPGAGECCYWDGIQWVCPDDFGE